MAYNYPRELVQISSQDASSSSNIQFTSGLSSNFDTYLVRISKMTPSSGSNVDFYTYFSTDGGSTYLSTNYNYSYIVNFDGSFLGGGATSAAGMQLIGVISNTTGPLNFDVTFYNLSNSLTKSIYHQYSFYKPSVVFGGEGFGNNTGTTAVNGIKFAWTGGNIATGNFTLYGVNTL